MSKYIDIEGLKTYHSKIKEIIETPATSTTAGVVKPDNTTITVSDDGTISAVPSLKIEVVDTLPTTAISTATIYFVPKITAGTDNVYSEYIYVNEKWELIGDTEVDLSEYLKTKDLAINAELVKGVKIAEITVGGFSTEIYAPKASTSSSNVSNTTVFNSDDSITVTYEDGTVCVTEFLSNGDIQETTTDGTTSSITIKTTHFDEDTIIETVEENKKKEK